jgi:hypothetical protein
MLQWLSEIALAGSLSRSIPKEGALTVAGQWRNFTAFPSILTIAVVTSIRPKLDGKAVME